MATVAPSPDFDWSKLGFDLYKTNGHIRYTYNDGSWDKGVWVKDPTITLNIGSVALNYGQSVFEGLKAFRAKDDTVRIFRPQENAKRIKHSAEFVSMPEVPESLFLDAVERCVAGNLEFVPPYAQNAASGALYLRPLLFGSGPNLILNAPTEFTFLVYCTPVGSLYGSGKGPVPAISCLVMEDFDRTAPKGTGSAKLAGNYAPVFKHTAAAKKEGYGITLHLDSQTRTNIDEFSTSNALFLYEKDGKQTLVVPESSSILKSVTTMSIIAIAQEHFKWDVERRVLSFEEVKSGKFIECAAAGTAAAITPVKTITYTNEGGARETVKFGDGTKSGRHFSEMLAFYTGLQCRDNEDTFGFLWPRDGIKASS